MDVLVVGAGAVGRWFARAIDADPTFADRHPDVARSAADIVGGAAVPLDGDERYDVVCIAVPIPAAVDVIHQQAGRAACAMVDVTGVMRPVVDAMREAVPDRQRASLHPLFAPENEPGNVALVADNPGAVTDDVVATLERRGNDVFETTPTEHDEAMETVQAKAHAAVLAYALAGDDVPEPFHTPVSNPLSDIVQNVTSGDPRVYADIQKAFDGAGDIASAAQRIADADSQAFEHLYRQARDNWGG